MLAVTLVSYIDTLFPAFGILYSGAPAPVVVVVVVVVVVDCFYVALFSTLKHTPCALVTWDSK